MKRNLVTLLAAGIGLGGCITENWSDMPGELWSDDFAGAQDGIYVRLPYAGLLVRLKDSGAISVVDLEGAEPQRLVTTPDGSKVLVFSEWTECKDDDDDIELIDDCDYDDLVTHSELSIVENGAMTSAVGIPSHLNTVSFSSDGDVAVAYLDYSEGGDIVVEGFADLGEVAFIDLVDGTKAGSTSVGFSPTRVLFAPNNQVVVMSRSQVVAVDLETYEKTLEAPLTLDADQQVDPSGAELAYDDESGAVTLLLTVDGSSDLYMLDLQTEYWNIGDLGAVPSSIGVDGSSSKSLFVFSASSKAVILDHGELSTLNSSSIEDIELEEPANSVLIGDSYAVLYNDSNDYVHDVYKVDLETQELTEYVLANPLSSLQLSASGAYAVGVMRPESSSYGSGLDYYQDSRYGLAVLDLSSNDAVSLVAESRPVGIELVEDGEKSYALALMEGVDSLLQIDLADPSGAVQIELPASPTSIGTLADGRFAISHDVGLGMVSFLNPETLEIQTVSGFAAAGLLQDDILPRRGEEQK